VEVLLSRNLWDLNVLNGAKRLNDLNSSEYACWLMPRAYYLFDDITRR
jgi:hypothetical protein